MEADPGKGTILQPTCVSLSPVVCHHHLKDVVVVILVIVVVIVVIIVVVVVVAVGVYSIESIDGRYDDVGRDPDECEEVEDTFLGASTLVTAQPSCCRIS